ncbi:hypothetical protein F5Y07DRAFT_337992 [Xylaria sp. FL0933]|nr:hypothetical protein F5Y07DRAFT_337992 [Xylaria sp. FL0933]
MSVVGVGFNVISTRIGISKASVTFSVVVGILIPINSTCRVTWEVVQVAVRAANGHVSDMTLDQSVPSISFLWIFEQKLCRIAEPEGDYGLDSFLELTAGAFEHEDEDGGTEYKRPLGLGVFAPILEEAEGDRTF